MLTPQAQRALLTFAESLLITAFITGAAAIEPLLLGSAAIDWQQAGMIFLFAFLFSLGHGILAYLKPNDANLQQALEMILDALERRFIVKQGQQQSTPPTLPTPPTGQDTPTQ